MKKSTMGFATAAVLFFAGVAWANPTQEEVFQSINDNVRSTVDISKAVPYLLIAGGVAILVALFNHHKKRLTFPRKANNPAKLSREMCRAISLRSVELKQLKLLAQDQGVEFPLTLILCPSILGKAIRTPGARVDRLIVKQLVQKLRQGLAETKSPKSE